MFLQLDFDDVKGTKAKGLYNGKSTNFLMIINTNEENISEALNKYGGLKDIVAFNYTGNTDFLNGVEIGDNIVLVYKNIDAVDMNVDFIMSSIDKRVRVVFILPEDYSNMQAIYNYSKKYRNIRFEGGKLIRLNDCNIGALGVDDISRKVSQSRIALVPKDYYSVFPVLSLDDVENIEFTTVRSPKGSKPTSSKPKSKSEVKKKITARKRALVTLPQLETSGLDNF